MKSRIFFNDIYQEIQLATLNVLNSQLDILSPRTLRSTRAAGDAIEEIITESFESILGKWSTDYSAGFARRAMADLAFTDLDGFYYVTDVKTHRTSTKFNMPKQIANSNRVNINPQYSRKKWMLELCDIVAEFYAKEIGKISERIGHFDNVREFWLTKSE